jgi:hypothetical protein
MTSSIEVILSEDEAQAVRALIHQQGEIPDRAVLHDAGVKLFRAQLAAKIAAGWTPGEVLSGGGPLTTGLWLDEVRCVTEALTAYGPPPGEASRGQD